MNPKIKKIIRIIIISNSRRYLQINNTVSKVCKKGDDNIENNWRLIFFTILIDHNFVNNFIKFGSFACGTKIRRSCDCKKRGGSDLEAARKRRTSVVIPLHFPRSIFFFTAVDVFFVFDF